MVHIVHGTTYIISEESNKYFLEIDGKKEWFETYEEAFHAYMDAIEEETE